MDSYLYQYLVGGSVFAAGFALAWRAGQLGWADPRARRRVLVLVAGLLFFAALQGALLLAGAR